MSIHIVTGVAGFIGSHLAETLLKEGIGVIGIDQFNDYYDPQLKQKNIVNLKEFANFKLIKADIKDLDWRELLQRKKRLLNLMDVIMVLTTTF